MESPLQRLQLPHGTVWVQRDDLLHPLVSGNKWRKLAGWLDLAKADQKTTLVTFGGAYSNHLVATAAAAQQHGFASFGILRGEEPMQNDHLATARLCGMTLLGVPRSVYRDKKAALASVAHLLPLAEACIIPEGGCGPPGWSGFLALAATWRSSGFRPSHVVHASATGTTAAGLALAMETRVEAVLVLKNLAEQQAQSTSPRISWHTGYEHGGYAKIPPVLKDFNSRISEANQIPLEPIYTGKALWALDEMLHQKCFLPEETCFLHTGGVLFRADAVDVGLPAEDQVSRQDDWAG